MAINVSKVVSVAQPIIFGNEGNYKSVNRNDNGAVSVGRIQWHADRALSLCKRIVNADKAAAKNTLSSALYNEITNKNTNWNTRIVSSTEANYLAALLGSKVGIKEQDDQMKEDVTGYVNHVISLGVTNKRAICFLADIENQGGAGRVKPVMDLCGVSKPSNINLVKIYKASLLHPVMGKYASRRTATYNALLKEFTDEYKTPKSSATSSSSTTHRVVSGDTLGKIAANNGTTVAKIVSVNKSKYPSITANFIAVGWTLTIPK